MTLTVVSPTVSDAVYLHYTDLLKQCDVEYTEVGATPVEFAQLADSHVADHLQALSSGWSDEWVGKRPDLLDQQLSVAGGLLRAAAYIYRSRTRRVFVAYGGNTLVMPDDTSHGAIFNDVVTAAQWFCRRSISTGIIDLSGTQSRALLLAAAADPNISVFSAHTKPRQAIPQPEGAIAYYTYEYDDDADDASLVHATELLLADLAAHSPDVIIMVTSTDVLQDSPHTTLDITLEGIHEAAYRVANLADEICDGRLIATGRFMPADAEVAPAVWAAVSDAITRPYQPLDQSSSGNPVYRSPLS